MQPIYEQIQKLLTPILKSGNAVLVDMQIKGNPGNQTIKIFVDTENGITLDRCETISRQLSEQLDFVDIMPGKYRLEVSSPGVNRPLRTLDDYHRNYNRVVEITYEDKREDKSFIGKIVDVSKKIIQIQGKTEIKKIPISKIKHGKIHLPW
ncbi:MAG: ribosome maturation factor RimP [bacterium]